MLTAVHNTLLECSGIAAVTVPMLNKACIIYDNSFTVDGSNEHFWLVDCNN